MLACVRENRQRSHRTRAIPSHDTSAFMHPAEPTRRPNCWISCAALSVVPRWEYQNELPSFVGGGRPCDRLGHRCVCRRCPESKCYARAVIHHRGAGPPRSGPFPVIGIVGRDGFPAGDTTDHLRVGGATERVRAIGDVAGASPSVRFGSARNRSTSTRAVLLWWPSR